MSKTFCQDWIILKDYKIFHLCNMFLKQKDYNLLEEILIELRELEGTKETPSLLTISLLFFIYHECLTKEMKKIYFDLEIALINFYGKKENIFKKMKYDDESDENLDLFHKNIHRMINFGLYTYTQDQNYNNEISLSEIELLIDDLFTLTFLHLSDRDIYGLVLTYEFIKNKLSKKGQEEYKAYLYNLLIFLIGREQIIFSHLLNSETFKEDKEEVNLDLKFKEASENIDLIVQKG